MRIVFLNPVAELGGAEQSLLAWMGAVRQALPGMQLVLIVPGEGPLAARARSAGVRVEVLPIPVGIAAMGDSALRRGKRLQALVRISCRAAFEVPGAWSYARRLKGLLARLKPDLIHSNGIKSHLALWLSRTSERRGAATLPPIVWHIHDFFGHRPVVAKLLRMVSRGVSAAIAVSDAVERDARRIIPQVPLHIVHNVVDLDRFAPGPASGAWLDQLANLPEATPATVRVVLVATYARWKGQDVFLQAASQVVRQAPAVPVRVYIVGGPIYRTVGSQFSREELQELAAKLGVEAHVGFIGYQSETADVYRAADIVVHASTQPEPFGLTIVEAMACGRATVVSEAGGAAELFSNRHDAIGTRPADAESLAGAILALAQDPESRSRLGRNARSTAESRFAPGRLLEQVVGVYRPILARRRGD